MAKCETVFVDRGGVKVMVNKSDLTDADKVWQSESIEKKPTPKRTAKPKKAADK